jgi:hypothetical protein
LGEYRTNNFFHNKIVLERNMPLISNVYLMQGYIVVGSWQAISMFIHIFNTNKFMLTPLRKIYNCITIICIATMPMGYLMLAILLYAAPFMAILYPCICGVEIFTKANRPYHN